MPFSWIFWGFSSTSPSTFSDEDVFYLIVVPVYRLQSPVIALVFLCQYCLPMIAVIMGLEERTHYYTSL